MTPHVDILDQPERLAKAFWGSVLLHISVAALVVFYGRIELSSKAPLMGDPGGGRFGSVAVNAVASIPLPARSGPQNPVASDTESAVPTPPPKAKPLPKAKAPEPDAIPLKSRSGQKKASERASAQPNKWRDQQKDQPNQVYSTAGQALNSPMYNLPGGGGVGIGTDSPFGTQFGWYAKLVRDQVARNWKQSDVDARLQTGAVVVTFTILRDGSVPPQSVKVSQTSGNRALDYSALRAVHDAVPFQALPPGFPRQDAAVELRFELRR
jgi:protein TonB